MLGPRAGECRLRASASGGTGTRARPQHEHQGQRGGISERPAQLRHVREVHPVDPRDDSPGNRDRAPRGDLADEPVQLVRDPGLEKVEYLLQVLAFQVGGVLQMPVLLAHQRQSFRVDAHHRLVDAEQVQQIVVHLVRLGRVDPNRLQVVPQLEEVLQHHLCSDRVVCHHPTLEISHPAGTSADQLLLPAQHHRPYRGDEVESGGGTDLSEVNLVPDDVQVMVDVRTGHRRVGRSEDGPQHARSQKRLQRLEMQQAVGPAGEPVDRAVMVVGVDVQLRHRGAVVHIAEVVPTRIDHLDEQGHAVLVGMVQMHPDDAVGTGGGVRQVGLRKVFHPGRRDPPNLHRYLQGATRRAR